MNPLDAVRQLGEHLHEVIRLHGRTSASLSQAIGFHPAFLSRAFRGQRPLRVRVVFEVLERLDVAPYEFFDHYYPFAGRALPQTGEVLRLPGLMSVVEMAKLDYLEAGRRAPERYRDELAAWLRRAIQRRKVSQRALSEQLGLGRYALGLALRGNSELTFAQLFGVLLALELDPGRCFFEALLIPPASPMDALRREQHFDQIEEALRQVEASFAARRAARESAQRSPPDPEPEGSEPPSEP